MFFEMAQHYVGEIQTSRKFYTIEYRNVYKVSQAGMRENLFGARVAIYVRKKIEEDSAFFSTEYGSDLQKEMQSIVNIEPIDAGGIKKYRISLDRENIPRNAGVLNLEQAPLDYEAFRQMIEIHNKNALISMLIRFESFLSAYFMWLIERYPEKYLAEKTIKYADLMKYDIDDMRHELLINTSDAILSQTIDEWLKIIKSHKIDLSPLNRYIETYKELNGRRNIIVHNNAQVNRQYLKCPGTRDKQLGEMVKTDQDYVIAAFDCVIILVYGILYASLKLIEEERSAFVSSLFDIGFEYMLHKEWEISRFIFLLLTKEKKQDENSIDLSLINYWISCKNAGQFEAVRDDIVGADFSQKDVSIRMAQAMLLEDYSLADSLLDESISSGKVFPDFVMTWPIFIQYRKTEYYQRFKQKYAAQINNQVLDDSDLRDAGHNPEAIEEITPNE